MKTRFIRPDSPLLDTTVVVIRGGQLDPDVIRDDAVRTHRIYGDYAISVFAADGKSVDELAQESPLVRFELLTLMTVGDLRTAGFELKPTGRHPLHYSIDFDNIETGIVRLLGCAHRTIPNPYHGI